MVTSQQWVKVVAKLMRDTAEGRVEWQRMSPPPSLTVAGEHVVSEFFGATYNGRNVGLYVVVRPVYDEYPDLLGRTARPTFALFTGDWRLQLEVPVQAGLDALLAAIRSDDADVDSFVDSVLTAKAS